MGTLFSFSLFSSIILATLYLCYKWVLAGENQHWFNRLTLWGIYTVSLSALPVALLISKLAYTPGKPPGIEVGLGDVTIVTDIIGVVEPEQPVYMTIILIVYLLGIIVVSLHTVWIAMRLSRLIGSGEHKEIYGYTLVLLPESNVAPFSWCRYVVMNRSDWEESGEMIVTHELQHLRLCHWFDLLLAQFVGIIQWYNPAAWLMREELKSVHEYQADDAVLSTGVNAKDYQMLLIKKAVGARFPSLANSLNHSKLKKRITMMYNSKTSRIRRMRGLAMVPACAVALFVTNIPAIANVIDNFKESVISTDKGNDFSSDVQPIINDAEESMLDVAEAAVIASDATKASESETTVIATTAAPDDKVYTIVEKRPEFPGGERALMNHIITNLRYPEAAENANVQGRVIATFVVKSDGSIGDVKIVRSVAPDIDAEAIRLIKSLPKFTPGTVDGKPVNVQYSLPLIFKLTDEEGIPQSDNASGSKMAPVNAGNQVFTTIEQKPEFPGGEIGLVNYIAKNIRYPESAKEKNIQGRVVARFVVNSDGSIGDVNIVRGVDPDIDAEAIRVIKSLPEFTPGKIDGKPVSVWYTLPLVFRNTDETCASDSEATSQVKNSNLLPENISYFINGEKADRETLLAISPNSIKSNDIRKDINRIEILTL
ncbi:MAG: M56 family metallopeptidase [Duncaniella sp.]|nr:M56 family metallopeptidase [Duncaniella sp.]